MARKRPIASQDTPPSRFDDAPRHKTVRGLSPSEIRALTRCAPLTKTEFRAQRQLADRNVFPPTARLTEPLAEAPGDIRE